MNNHQQNSDMSLTSHLQELRTRLLRCIVVVLSIFMLLIPVAHKTYSLAAAPLQRFLPDGTSMIATGVAAPFLTPFKLTAWLAFFVAIPFVLHQIWGFISPGLYKKEQHFALPVLCSSVILFYSGMLFAYFAVFPVIFSFFASVTPEGVQMMTDITQYLDFIIALFFAFGIAFEVPIVVLLLIWSGLTSIEKLRQIRPYVIVGCFVVGMILTPPDVFSQTMLAIPMWALYEIGLLSAKLATKSKKS